MEVCIHTDRWHFTHPSLRKLDGVIVKLEPLSEQHVLVGFLRNVDNTKILNGLIRELADAITDYQVWVAGHLVCLFNESPPRFRYNKECMRR